MVVDLKPVFQRNPNLKEILRSYKDAEKALASGNYHAALLKAQESRDQITEGNALIMCGSIERGLHKLQGAESIYKIYGEWCLNGKESIISSLKNYQSLKTLDNLFNKQKINLLLLCGPHTKNLDFCSQLEEFNLHISTIGRDSVTSTLANLMPADFSPDAIILLDVYGHRIPNDLYEINIPKVFLTYDFDLQLPNQYQDLQRANLKRN